ncbi:hypothetical protein HYX18_02100 [Candidatus Woesearchaeota archaeon]|nr:hypothetical protein [Candidatus Woesearchaeota archaeon]
MIYKDLLITLYIQAIFVSIAFWESYLEGYNAWAQGKHGWKVRVAFLKKEPLTAYHLFLYLITIPLFLMLPLIIFGFNRHIFLLLVANYFVGLVVEDFIWFVANPVWGGLKNFNSRKVYWHRFFKIGNFEIPDFYLYFSVLALIIFSLLYFLP